MGRSSGKTATGTTLKTSLADAVRTQGNVVRHMRGFGDVGTARGVEGRGRAARIPVERAYARSDLLAQRRRLMDDWAAYLAGER